MSSWRAISRFVDQTRRTVSRRGQLLAVFVTALLGAGVAVPAARADEGAVPPPPAAVESDPPGPPPAAPASPSLPVIPEPPPPSAPASVPGGPILAPTIAAPAEAPPPPVLRPRFAIAAAIGVSVDNVGIADHRNVAIPSFSVQGGIGQDVLGFDARLFASEAAGQFSTASMVSTDNKAAVADVGADRQAVDLMLAVRPFARWRRARMDWPARFVRALTLDVGAAGERVSVGAQTVMRLGAVMAAYVDLPLTPAWDTSALHLRLAARRMVGSHGTVAESGASEPVGDTTCELLGGLAVIF